jgi:hypothetical protein
MGTNATLDITDNALVLDYTGDSPVDAIREKLIAGRGGAGLGRNWNGSGITSSSTAQANATAPDTRSVGYAENAELPLGAYTFFRGQAVDSTTILIAFARTADANLDGIVENDDVTIVGANYTPGAAKPAWALGDFEYSGSVDDDDVTLVGVFYRPAPSPLPELATVAWTAPDDSIPSAAQRGRAIGGNALPSASRAPNSIPLPESAASGVFGRLQSARTSNSHLESQQDDMESLIALLAESMVPSRTIHSLTLADSRPASLRRNVTVDYFFTNPAERLNLLSDVIGDRSS